MRTLGRYVLAKRSGRQPAEISRLENLVRTEDTAPVTVLHADRAISGPD